MTSRPAAISSAPRARSGLRLAALALVAGLAVAAPIAGATAAHAASVHTGVVTSQTQDAPKKPTPGKPSGAAVTWAISPATSKNIDTKRAFYDYSAKPGETLRDHVAVTNYSARPVAFHVYAADGTTDYTTAQFTLIAGSKSSKDLGAWTSIEGGTSACPAGATRAKLTECLAKLGTTVTVQPKTAVIVPFTVTIPKNASPGDHAAGIVAAYTEKGAGKTAVGVEHRIGTRIYLRVAGKLTPQLGVTGAVTSFRGGKNPFGSGTATIGFDLTDEGNTRLSGAPSFDVTGPFGIPIAGASAKEVENLLPGGVAHVQTVVKNVPRLFLIFGGITVTPQHADGNVSSDKLPPVVHSDPMTWAVPWIWVLIVLVAAAAVVGYLWWRRRSRERLATALHDYVQQARADARGEELVPQGGESESQR